MNGKVGKQSVTDTSKLAEELMKLEDHDNTWELAVRNNFLRSKRTECNKLAKSLTYYGFSQWDINALLCGGFLAQCFIGILSFSPLLGVFPLYAFLVLFQLRIKRDKYTLYTNLIIFSIYASLFSVFTFIHRGGETVFPVISGLMIFALLHLATLAILGKYTNGGFERFSDSLLELRFPSAQELHGVLIGMISFLGISFAIVRLYGLFYVAFIVVLFSSFARLRLGMGASMSYEAHSKSLGKPKMRNIEIKNTEYFPIVRSVISMMFTASALSISTFSLLKGNFFAIDSQESFTTWMLDNEVGELYVGQFMALGYVMTLSLSILLSIQFLFMLNLLLKVDLLDSLLYHHIVLLGRVLCDSKGIPNYCYDIYTLDSRGRVIAIEPWGRRVTVFSVQGCLPVYSDLYLRMQKRALKEGKMRSIYCLLNHGVAKTLTAERNPLIKCRMKLESWSKQLDGLIEDERNKRDSIKLEHKLKQLERMRFLQRPKYKSRSIPTDSDDNGNLSSGRLRRSLSIPTELSLPGVQEMLPVVRLAERFRQERCKTTCISDDYYYRPPGIIDRVRGSWLNPDSEEFIGHYEGFGNIYIRGDDNDVLDNDVLDNVNLNATVIREPNNGEFCFKKIDRALASIFNKLSLLDSEKSAIILPDLNEDECNLQCFDYGIDLECHDDYFRWYLNQTCSKMGPKLFSDIDDISVNFSERDRNKIIIEIGDHDEATTNATASEKGWCWLEKTLKHTLGRSITPLENKKPTKMAESPITKKPHLILLPEESLEHSASNTKPPLEKIIIYKTSSSDLDSNVHEYNDDNENTRSQESVETATYPTAKNRKLRIFEGERSVKNLADFFDGIKDDACHEVDDDNRKEEPQTLEDEFEQTACIREFEVREPFRGQSTSSESPEKVRLLECTRELPLALEHSHDRVISVNPRPSAPVSPSDRQISPYAGKNTGNAKKGSYKMRNEGSMPSLGSSGGDAHGLMVPDSPRISPKYKDEASGDDFDFYLEDIPSSFESESGPESLFEENTARPRRRRGTISPRESPVVPSTELIMRELLQDISVPETDDEPETDRSYNFMWQR